MATFKPVTPYRKSDGTRNVQVRITHNGDVRRLATQIFVAESQITKSGRIKNPIIEVQIQELLNKCRQIANDISYQIDDMSVAELAEYIKNELYYGKRSFELDFFEYGSSKTESMKEGTAKNYTITLNALKRYCGDKLDISEIDTQFLRSFERFLISEPSQRSCVIDKPKGSRAISLYMSNIRALHNMAKDEFNDDDRGIIRIPLSPFKKYKMPAVAQTRKRAVSVETIQKIIDLPYGTDAQFNLAKDCFILSFALIGMNSTDMYSCAAAGPTGVIKYYRKKTTSRRADKAEMHVMVEQCITQLMWKYRDADCKYAFNFHKRYSSPQNFNSSINRGLKRVGAVVGIEDLEFYAARHSWATIARSSAVGIDKMTVHEALNHVDSSMKVTDIYIDRDWSVIWNANKKVLELFDWAFFEKREGA